MKGTTIRVITPRGRAREAHYAAQTAPQLLALLERYFGIPYPFDKLDLLAVPEYPMAMFERWVGERSFRKGLQQYLTRHAWGNATAGDFIAAESAATRQDLRPAFSSFLDQAGVPLVTVELQCENGRRPRLRLAQRRYLPLGSPGAAPQTWRIPVSLKYEADGRPLRARTLLRAAHAEQPLAGASCPHWLLANEDQAGYYRVLYRCDLLARLLRAGPSLTLAERAGLVNDTNALVRNGEMPAGDALALLPQFLRTPERHIIQGTMGTVREMNDLLPEALRPRYAQFIRRTYGEMAHRLGWSPRPGEGDETRLLRPGLLSLVAGPGEDPALIAEAGRLAGRWLEDRKSLDPDLVGAVLEIAARNGDRALFDRFHAAARQTSDPMERARLLRALGAFRDPAILRAVHHLALTDEFPPNEAIGLAFAGLGESRTRPLAYEFVKQNFDALVARVPRNDAAALLYSAGGFADAEHRADAEAFFGPRAAKLPGGPRLLAQVLEQVRLNIALKRAQLPSLEAFLQSPSVSRQGHPTAAKHAIRQARDHAVTPSRAR